MGAECYTESERIFAQIIGLPNDPDVLEFARRLRCLNESADDIKKHRSKSTLSQVLDDILSIVQVEAA